MEPKKGKKQMEQKEPKVFHDPIHGQMEFNYILVKVIDTPQFQRLRFIKQLGGASFVYPAASHNRFEHSLGVAHLAGQFVQHLQEKQEELHISERDKCCVEIAGLCHDLGHGPFSHLFDGKFIPKAKPGSTWKHEETSLMMFDKIVEDLEYDLEWELKQLDVNTENTEGDDLQFIKELINGPDEEGRYKGRPADKSFLYEIISNKRNGLDVDKFDYFARDFYQLGIQNSFDHNRYFQCARVIEVDGLKQICIRDKELPNIYEMFHVRGALHRKACQHKTHQTIELMITDALIKADEKNPTANKRYQSAIDQDKLGDYTQLTDDIFEKILYSGDELKEAKDILRNILQRKLYTFLGRTKMTDELDEEDVKKKKEGWKTELAKMTTYYKEEPLTEKDFEIIVKKKKEGWKTELAKTTTYYKEESLTEKDFEIIITTFDFGDKGQNPIDNLKVYHKCEEQRAYSSSSDQVSQFLVPKKFSEKWISVYCKSSGKTSVAQRSFTEWCRRNKLPLLPSPSVLQTPEQPKVFNDPIHGQMEFHPLLVKIIDTPEFQRLRFLKQLGGAYYVYPGASHSRFEHSLGVAHLAGQFLRSLKKTQDSITDKDILCVQIAGLCYDLGQGPFPDDFDTIFLQKKYPKLDWNRSTMSEKIFQKIKPNLNLSDHLKEKDIVFIEELIKGLGPKDTPTDQSQDTPTDQSQDTPTDQSQDTPTGRPQEKHFLYDILSNRSNGVGVKLFDSVLRDCFHLGLKTNFDHQRFIKLTKVKKVEGKNQICFRDKVMSSMCDLFHTIAALQDKAYQHRVTLSVQLMMSEAVEKQLKVKLEEKPKADDLQINLQLTDSLFGDRATEELEGKDIMSRIHRRDLYKHVTKVELTGSDMNREQCIKRAEECIKKVAEELNIEPDDVEINREQWINELAKECIKKLAKEDKIAPDGTVKNWEQCIKLMEECIKKVLKRDDVGISVSNRKFGAQDPICGMKFFDKSGEIIPHDRIDKTKLETYRSQMDRGKWVHVFLKDERR